MEEIKVQRERQKKYKQIKVVHIFSVMKQPKIRGDKRGKEGKWRK